MAKDINLGKPKPAPQPAAPPLSTMPKPAKTSSNYTGTPPMPSGQIVGCINPSTLLPAERENLEQWGWTPDIPIPENMASIMQQVKAQRSVEAEEVVLPIDPRTPPLKVKTKKIEEVSAEDQQRLRQAMLLAIEQQKAAREQEAAREREEAAGSIPGLREMLDTAKTSAKKQATTVDTPVVVNAAPEATPKATTAPAPESPKSETGAVLRSGICPHCWWDQSIPDVAEPPYGDKMSFLHSLLGQKPWKKEMTLFGGNVFVCFRTLTTSELDTLYKQAYQDRSMGRIIEERDFWERLNRYRLFLQLCSMRSNGGPEGFQHDLPDGLSKETNPDAEGVWYRPDDNVQLEPGETMLPQIESFIVAKVLKSDSVFRAVHAACNEFNRVVAKMEAMADNQDFWRPTEAQP
jgi:hypothetical protein